jgi:hypothetical protein
MTARSPVLAAGLFVRKDAERHSNNAEEDICAS